MAIQQKAAERIADSPTEDPAPASEVGQRLKDAREADREWRMEQVRRLHRRLRLLRQSETVIPRVGIGLGLLLLLGAASPLFTGYPRPAFGPGWGGLQGLMQGAVAVLVGSLAAILLVAAYQEWLGRRLVRMGLDELSPEGGLAPETGPPAPAERWICARCRDKSGDPWPVCTCGGAPRPVS